jgi:hypothetical protein
LIPKVNIDNLCLAPSKKKKKSTLRRRANRKQGLSSAIQPTRQRTGTEYLTLRSRPHL